MGDRVPLALIVVLVLATHIKILSYATGQDSFTYIRLANDLLDAPFEGGTWREIAAFIVPGYPVLLAVVMALLGPLATAWVNPVLFAGGLLLVYGIARRWRLPPADALLMNLIALLLVLRAYPLNAHFLLYAFRGTPQFFFMAWSVFILSGKAPSARPWPRLACACLVVMLGASMRETTLAMLPGLLAYVVVAPAWRTDRGKVLGILGALMALILGATVMVWRGWLPGNNQLLTWLGTAFGDGAAYRARLWASLSLVTQGGGVLMMGLLAIALAGNARRYAERVVVWLLPALVLILFYAGFLVHQRYVLESFVLLAVLAGLGGAQAWAWSLRRVGSKPGSILTGCLTVLLVGLVIGEIDDLPEWNTRVRASQVRTFVKTITAHSEDTHAIVADPSCMLLAEGLMVHARRDPIFSARDALQALREAPALLFVRPVSYDHLRAWPDFDLLDRLRWGGDLDVVRDDERMPVTVRLGTVRYSLYRIEPWSRQRVDRELSRDAFADRLFWLDFRGSNAHAQRHAELLDGDGNVLQRWAIGDGNGMIPFVLDAHPRTLPAPVTLTVRSSDVLPSDLWVPRERYAVGGLFPMTGVGRPASLLEWFQSPVVTDTEARWGALMLDEANLRLPMPRGAHDRRVWLRIDYRPRVKESAEVVFAYSVDGGEPERFVARLDQGLIRHAVALASGTDGMRPWLDVRVHVEVPAAWREGEAYAGNYFRVISAGIVAADADP